MDAGTFELRNDLADGGAPRPPLAANGTASPTPRGREDAALLESLIEDRPAAWREFQRRYDALVMRCIANTTRRFSCVTPCDMRDIYAQLLLSLIANDHAKLRAFDPSRGSRFSSYLGMLAIHCAYDHLRSARREPRCEELTDALPLANEDADPYEQAVQRERADLATRVLAGFSERDRVFAALYFGEGLDPVEIARSMKISLKTVYSKKHKIKAKLESIVTKVRGERLAS
jgi:RNA polymerase sigma-70 factor (ECF subfamily)